MVALARTPGEGLVCEFGDHRSVDHRTAHGGNCAVDTCPRSAWQWRWHCTAVTSRGALVHRPQYLRERLYRFRRERPCRSIAVALPENSKVGNGSRLCENAKFRYRVLAASAFGQPIRPRWVMNESSRSVSGTPAFSSLSSSLRTFRATRIAGPVPTYRGQGCRGALPSAAPKSGRKIGRDGGPVTMISGRDDHPQPCLQPRPRARSRPRHPSARGIPSGVAARVPKIHVARMRSTRERKPVTARVTASGFSAALR